MSGARSMSGGLGSMTLLDRLRASLDHPAPADLTPGDMEDGFAPHAIEAAVLVAITDRPEPGVLLTTRRENMRQHAGQVAFPGGRVDLGEDVIAAALREADEELGLPPAAPSIWGLADPYITVTGYRVTPVLAAIPPDLDLSPHEPEVADWFEAPLSFLMNRANHRRMSAEFRGATRHYWQIDWQGRRIWGATAAMLVNLSRRIEGAT
jgi:8-oxo-dGTP pyrophosphatase MutT (NUDIX family)